MMRRSVRNIRLVAACMLLSVFVIVPDASRAVEIEVDPAFKAALEGLPAAIRQELLNFEAQVRKDVAAGTDRVDQMLSARIDQLACREAAALEKVDLNLIKGKPKEALDRAVGLQKDLPGNLWPGYFQKKPSDIVGSYEGVYRNYVVAECSYFNQPVPDGVLQDRNRTFALANLWTHVRASCRDQIPGCYQKLRAEALGYGIHVAREKVRANERISAVQDPADGISSSWWYFFPIDLSPYEESFETLINIEKDIHQAQLRYTKLSGTRPWVTKKIASDWRLVEGWINRTCAPSGTDGLFVYVQNLPLHDNTHDYIIYVSCRVDDADYTHWEIATSSTELTIQHGPTQYTPDTHISGHQADTYLSFTPRILKESRSTGNPDGVRDVVPSDCSAWIKAGSTFSLEEGPTTVTSGKCDTRSASPEQLTITSASPTEDSEIFIIQGSVGTDRTLGGVRAGDILHLLMSGRDQAGKDTVRSLRMQCLADVASGTMRIREESCTEGIAVRIRRPAH